MNLWMPSAACSLRYSRLHSATARPGIAAMPCTTQAVVATVSGGRSRGPAGLTSVKCVLSDVSAFAVERQWIRAALTSRMYVSSSVYACAVILLHTHACLPQP